MQFYLGGYFLLQLNLYRKETGLYTCSSCVNENLLTNGYDLIRDVEHRIATSRLFFPIPDEKLTHLRAWAARNGKGFKDDVSEGFADVSGLLEYQKLLLSHLESTYILSIYFDEKEAERLIRLFENDEALHIFLSKEIKEEDSSVAEEILGYDLIGVEGHNSFHSFHCHYSEEDLPQGFNLTLNEYGLLNEVEDWQPIVDYMNNGGGEPVPWFVVKVKKVIV